MYEYTICKKYGNEFLKLFRTPPPKIFLDLSEFSQLITFCESNNFIFIISEIIDYYRFMRGLCMVYIGLECGLFNSIIQYTPLSVIIGNYRLISIYAWFMQGFHFRHLKEEIKGVKKRMAINGYKIDYRFISVFIGYYLKLSVFIDLFLQSF